MRTKNLVIFQQLNEQDLTLVSGGALGENIRQARLDHQMMQAMLAQVLFVSKQAVSQWENGARDPNIETVVRLREVLHVSFEKLLG